MGGALANTTSTPTCAKSKRLSTRATPLGTSMKPTRIKDRKLLNETRARPCLICGRESDPAHIKSRGSGGDDVPQNLLSLCRRHHSEQHQSGWGRFSVRYPIVDSTLAELGWQLETLFGRTRLVRK